MSARRVALAAFASALLASVAIACGPDEGEYAFVRTERAPDGGTRDSGPPDAGPVDAGPPDAPIEPLEDWDTADAGPLSGIYVAGVNIKAKVVIDLEAKQLYRLRVLQHGRTLRLKTTPCQIRLPEVPGVALLSIPPALQTVIESKSIEDEGEFLSAEDPIGATFAPPPATLVLGATLADEMNDPLPTMEDQTTALDEDGDGNPGVTLDATTVLCRGPERAYAAIRAIAMLDGTVADESTIMGDVVPRLEWGILGVSHMCLSPATELMIEIQPGSTFVAERVGDAQDLNGDGNVTCPEIVWHASAVLGDGW